MFIINWIKILKIKYKNYKVENIMFSSQLWINYFLKKFLYSNKKYKKLFFIFIIYYTSITIKYKIYFLQILIKNIKLALYYLIKLLKNKKTIILLLFYS